MTVPILSTRDRAVWTNDERKHLDRCAKDFNAHGDKLIMVCGNPCCPEPTIRLHPDEREPAGAVLRCGCTDRVFMGTPDFRPALIAH